MQLATNKDEMISKPIIVFILGSPASGKGTLGTLLAEGNDLCHISVGDYLRKLIKDGFIVNPKIKDSVAHSGTKGLVPGNELVPHLLDKIRIEMSKNGKEVFLLDGFPRNIDQDEVFRETMKREFGMESPNYTVFISCEKEVAKVRFLGRKRENDDEKMFENRYADFESRDMEVVERYRGSLIEVKVTKEMTKKESYSKLLEALKSRNVEFLKQ